MAQWIFDGPHFFLLYEPISTYLHHAVLVLLCVCMEFVRASLDDFRKLIYSAGRLVNFQTNVEYTYRFSNTVTKLSNFCVCDDDERRMIHWKKANLFIVRDKQQNDFFIISGISIQCSTFSTEINTKVKFSSQ